jgi:hypothetical protein
MWFAPLLGGLIDICGSLVGQVLIALGISFFTYSGVDASLSWAKSHFFSSASGLPAVALQVMGVLQLDVVVSMLVSALTGRMTMKGMQAGAVKLMRFK